MAEFLHSFVKGSTAYEYMDKNLHMIKGILRLSVFCFGVSLGFAQEPEIRTDKTLITNPALDSMNMQAKDSIKKPEIKLGNDPEADWKSGKSKYQPRPKHMWELGIGVGQYFIAGDVDTRYPGYGFSLHLRRALGYALSIRLDGFYGIAYGLEPQPYTDALDNEQDVFKGYGTASGNNAWFPAYKTQYFYGAAQAVFNIGNILFHKDHTNWNFYSFVGIGLDHNITKLDLRDPNGNVYTNLINKTGYTADRFNTKKGRSEIKDELNNIYDGTYETEAPKKRGVFRFNDETNVHVAFMGGLGVSRRLSRRVNLAIEHQVTFTDNDYLDGVAWRSSLDLSTQNDVQHYTNFRLGINLGSFKKRKEPMYWLNPLDAIFNDIAELKRRPIFDPTDSDNDGVIDLLDQEDDSPEGASVDTRGITLDSDNDGIPDHKDAEPYSPPGFQVDDKGVAQQPVQPNLSEDDVRNLVDQRLGIPPGMKDGDAGRAFLNNVDWFLPMIHFNLDQYCVLEKFAPELASVAHVMNTHPGMKITVYGHTDDRHSNAYNMVLSYNRAKEAIDYLVNVYELPRDRFILMFGGEETPLGGHQKNHNINRRVEFRVSKAEDKEMERPKGPNAGSCSKKYSRKSRTPGNTGQDAKNQKSGF